jgi:(2R)-3-sulfolactate dehydrogenase (NADP+)
MPFLNKSQAQSLASKKLIKSGCIMENSLGIIDGILDAEFSGIKSHGFHYLPIYCNHLRIGKINGNASPKLEQISSSSIKVNADNGFAHTAINMGLKLLCEMSKNEGISCMSVNNSYNCGVLGFHTKRIAEKNLIGIGFTNAPASIAPIGSTKPVIGTNPYSIAAPQNGEVLIIIDQSASVVAKSEISVRAKLDEPIPEGWAFDKDGNVTTNAKDALKGTMAPTGGYKGFGAGLMVEILASCVAGGNLGTRASSFAGEDGGPPSTGQFFIAINPKKFNSDYDSYLEELVNSIKTQEESRLPGSKRLSKFNENVNKDIFISDELMSRIELI